tara:strand:- start:1113 stop:1751 length:639 start_codon:yes stop_codon:yes gene_type:complete
MELDNGEGRQGYWHGEYAKRTSYWLDPDTKENGEKATEYVRKRREGKRRCTYCNKTGHNRRTCPELKEAKAAAITETARVRREVMAALERTGLGVGSLVTVNSYDGLRGYMVKGFNWEYVTAKRITNNPHIVQLQVLNAEGVSRWDRDKAVPLPPIEGVNENSWDQIELVGPVSGTAALATIPEGFADDQDWLKEQFAEAKSPNFHENRYNC